MTMSHMDSAGEAEHEVLQSALDHAWAWYTARFGQYFQLLNSALLMTAILSAGYVAALNAALPALAACTAVTGSVASLATAYVSRLIQQRADVAVPALAQIQQRLAAKTGIDELRMFATAQRLGGASPRVRHIADTVMVLAAAAWLAAAAYSLSA